MEEELSEKHRASSLWLIHYIIKGKLKNELASQVPTYEREYKVTDMLYKFSIVVTTSK